MSTHLFDAGRRAIIESRVHTQDLCTTVELSPLEWQHLLLPMDFDDRIAAIAYTMQHIKDAAPYTMRHIKDAAQKLLPLTKEETSMPDENKAWDVQRDGVRSVYNDHMMHRYLVLWNDLPPELRAKTPEHEAQHFRHELGLRPHTTCYRYYTPLAWVSAQQLTERDLRIAQQYSHACGGRPGVMHAQHDGVDPTGWRCRYWLIEEGINSTAPEVADVLLALSLERSQAEARDWCGWDPYPLGSI